MNQQSELQQNPAWVVIKFGGTSVSDLKSWQNIQGIIQLYLAQKLRIIVVCSAATNITNLLENLLTAALTNNYQNIFSQIKNKYLELCNQLSVEEQIISPFLSQLNQLIEGIALLKEISPRTRAQVMAFGELILTQIGTTFLKSKHMPVEWQDARDLLQSEENPSLDNHKTYLMAKCTTEHDPLLIQTLNQKIHPVIITQGFIASNTMGETVLLGRGGSDTSAAYFAAKINATCCEIWTDVPGIYSANPHQIPEARLLRQLDYDEAQEIASMGGKVLHPNCIHPLKQQQIPLYIKYTQQPERDGTLVSAKADSASMQIKSIMCKYGVILISIETVRMWHQVGFLAKVFDCFKKHNLSIDLVSTSESNVTVSLDIKADAQDAKVIDALLADLNLFAKAHAIGPCATISLIGHNIRASIHKLGAVFEVFEQQKIHLLSQAANDLNLTFVVDEDQTQRIAQKIHTLLIEENANQLYFNESWLQEFGEVINQQTKPWWYCRHNELIDLAQQQATPLYVYEQDCLIKQAQKLSNCTAVDRILYAIKANYFPPILKQFQQMNLGFECVSINEVEHVLKLFPQIDPTSLLFTPNFAPYQEYQQAMNLNIPITIDNLYPLENWPQIFTNKEIFIRIDPGHGYGHHKYVCTGGVYSKFGIPLTELDRLQKICSQHQIKITGLHSHVGSGILRAQTWQENSVILTNLLNQFPDVKIINLGGGLGIVEKPGQKPLDLEAVNLSLKQVKAAFPQLQLWLEPGRFLVANAGVLLAKVTQVKAKGNTLFIGIDAGMNSLIRPALYGSYHEIVNLTRLEAKKTQIAHIVGPICESGDTLGYSRLLPDTHEGDVLLIANTGAYGSVMSSHYNLRNPAPEYFLQNNTTQLPNKELSFA